MDSRKSRPMFEQMADEIAHAVLAVVDRYAERIKKRKVSRGLRCHWIYEGAARAVVLDRRSVRRRNLTGGGTDV